MEMGHYFIALIAPEAIEKQVRTWKEWMRTRFGCKVALKSPAHITLVPPFRMHRAQAIAVQEFLDKFAAAEKAFEVGLQGFGHFRKRVLFVGVERNQPLSRLYDQLQHAILAAFPDIMEPDERPFHPHMTIATRDIPAEAFDAAWEHFSQVSFTAVMPVRYIALLYLHPGKWEVIHESPLLIN